MISNAADEIATIVNKLIIEVRETEEEFVWTQVEPWLSRTMERHISKRELVKALQKQIPKKPTEKYNHGNFVIDWLCPSCGRFHRNDYPLEYCSHCGQAIDWGEDE